jgi:NADPH2:quinone reductase
VLQPQPVDVPAPGPGELRLRNLAIGVNFHDIYVRTGLYRTLTLPGIPGLEGVGEVEEVGAGVTAFAPGDRIAYLDPGYGAYASHRLLAEALAIPVPPAVASETAAACLLKGLTAGILVHDVHPVGAGTIVLVHAAAGGVGHLLSQWAKLLGARVIGTVGSEDKAALARTYGCDTVIRYDLEDFAARILDLTDGRGVDVAYDAVGAATFDGSLRSLAVRGHLVNYGQSSGPVPPFEISRLAPKSLSVTRAGYSHYVPDAPARRAMAARLFDAIATGLISPRPPRLIGLAEAAESHARLEARELGPFVLIP